MNEPTTTPAVLRLARAIVSIAAATACSAGPSSDPSPSDRPSSAVDPTGPGGSTSEDGEGATGSNGSGGATRAAPAPDQTYEDTRTSQTVDKLAGPDTPCLVGTFVDPGFTLPEGAPRSARLHDDP